MWTRVCLSEVSLHRHLNQAMSNLFNPFKQAQRLTGGTGLGMAASSKLCTQKYLIGLWQQACTRWRSASMR